MNSISIDAVRELLLQGRRVIDIAEILGATKGVISGIIHRHQLRTETPVPVRVRPPWNEQDIQRVREIAARGGTYREIGQLYGLAREAARQRMRGLGISTTKPARVVPKAAEPKREIRATAAPKPVIAKPVVEPTVVAKPLGRIGRAGCDCQWPLSNGRPWRFCGVETVPGKSYCAEHVRISRAGSTEAARAA